MRSGLRLPGSPPERNDHAAWGRRAYRAAPIEAAARSRISQVGGSATAVGPICRVKLSAFAPVPQVQTDVPSTTPRLYKVVLFQVAVLVPSDFPDE